MGFDAIPEDREQSFPCGVCNGSIKLSAISGLWECAECGCLPGSKLVVTGHTKEEPKYHCIHELIDPPYNQHESWCNKCGELVPSRPNIQRYSLDRCDPVMDVEDDGEWCRWDDVSQYVEHEPCENCHLSPTDCKGLTQKQACAKLKEILCEMYKYKIALTTITKQPLEPAHIYEIADRIKLIAKVALEI